MREGIYTYMYKARVQNHKQEHRTALAPIVNQILQNQGGFNNNGKSWDSLAV